MLLNYNQFWKYLKAKHLVGSYITLYCIVVDIILINFCGLKYIKECGT